MKKHLSKSIFILTALVLVALSGGGCARPANTKATTPEHDIDLENRHRGVTFHKKYIDGIPVLDVFKDDKTKKPTVFVLHGYGGNKYYSVDLAVRLARKGYYSVIFDAYGHGERVGGPLKSFPEVMALYPYDIDAIVNSLKDNSQADLDNLGMMGVSMGACAIYKYCTFGKIKPKAIAPFIGTPYFEQLMDSELSRMTYDEKAGKGTSPLSQQQLNSILAENSPYKAYLALKDIAILMQQGETDDMIISQGVSMLYHDLTGIGATNVELIIHENLWHEVSDEGWDNAFEFMDKHLK